MCKELILECQQINCRLCDKIRSNQKRSKPASFNFKDLHVWLAKLFKDRVKMMYAPAFYFCLYCFEWRFTDQFGYRNTTSFQSARCIEKVTIYFVLQIPRRSILNLICFTNMKKGFRLQIFYVAFMKSPKLEEVADIWVEQFTFASSYDQQWKSIISSAGGY